MALCFLFGQALHRALKAAALLLHPAGQPAPVQLLPSAGLAAAFQPAAALVAAALLPWQLLPGGASAET